MIATAEKQNGSDTIDAVQADAVAVEQQPIERREATVMEIAAVIAGSRDFPDVRTPEKAAVRILAGRELGVGPVQSVIGIRIQAGRVSIDAGLIASLITNSGRYYYKILNHTNDECTLLFAENGVEVGRSTFTIADAEKAKLMSKDTWKNFPRNMLFARALSNGARWYCAGIFGGAVYTHEELGLAVDEDGRAVEVDNSGFELCTKDQRNEIYSLVAATGDTMPNYVSKLGIKLLDELSVQEADKEIKRLQKKVLKAGVPEMKAPDNSTDASAPNVGANNAKTAPASSPSTTAAQTTMQEAFDDAKRHSSPEQRNSIIEMAQQLIPDEAECCETIKAWLTKRSRKKLAELNWLEAESIIEGLKAALANEPPFEPTPTQTPGTGKKS